MASTKVTTPNLTPGGWVRIALYVIAVLAGLAAVLAEPLGFGGLEDLLVSVSGVLLVATGGTAALNVQRAPDQQIDWRDLIAGVFDVKNNVELLRAESATPATVADELEARRVFTPAPPAPEDAPAPQHAAPSDEMGLPVYHQTTTAEG